MDPFERLGKKASSPAQPEKLDETEHKEATEDLSTSAGDASTKRKKIVRKPVQKWATGVTGQVKKGKKISPRTFIIGCIIFLIVFLWLVWVGLFYAVTSSEFLQVVGLEVDDIKNLLTIFAILLFGIVFFVGFYMLVLNIYRLATVKQKKTKYIIGLIGGVLVIAATITLGTLTIMRINSLVGETRIQTNQIILPYLQTRDDAIRVGQGIPVIAPAKMRFQVNRDNYARFIGRDVGSNQITSFILDCGNEQRLVDTTNAHAWAQNSFFADSCLYTSKGTYDLVLEVGYFNRQTGDEELLRYAVGSVDVAAEITLRPLEDTVRLNDRRDEQIIGTAPVIMDFRSQLLFSDLRLNRTRVQWDLNGNRQIDLEDTASFQFSYREPQLYTVNYRLPDLPQRGTTWFSFDMRVLQSELPVCTMAATQVEGTERSYRFRPWFAQQTAVQRYVYAIYDTQQQIYLESVQTAQAVEQYTFPRGGEFEVHTTYYTPDNARGRCESITVNVGHTNNVVDFDLQRRQSAGTEFTAAGNNTSVTKQDDLIVATIVPVTLQFMITEVRPDPNSTVTAWYDGTQIFPVRDNVYEITSSRVHTWNLEFRIVSSQGDESRQQYTIATQRKPVVAQLEPSVYVGEDPLTVTLDASMSPLYSENDEIVYFTWDFGDGNIQQNVSQWVMEYTYRFDNEKNTGEYYPSVTVRTRLWFEDTYRLSTPIVVKRQQHEASIIVESHPTQQARVNELVSIVLESDGIINNIAWDFGNGRQATCADRSCTTTATRYEEPGEYTIRVTVDYENNTPTTTTLRMRVFE